ncbi:MAG: Mut7-C RNAse domain-containing protein [Chloroflexota bacterium]
MRPEEKVADPKFIVDLNVGRLAKWLRIMGYDALFVPGIEDGELVRLAQKESRIVLTRDRFIMKRGVVTSGKLKALLIDSEGREDQLRQVVDTYQLKALGGFSRCIECNASLTDVAREEVQERVPAYVFQTQEEFMECPSCRRLYWRGTHWRNMRQELARVEEGQP